MENLREKIVDTILDLLATILRTKRTITSEPTTHVHQKLRLEVWRNGKLVDSEEKERDLVVNSGLNALCSTNFDGSGNRAAPFTYCAIGTDSTTPSASQTALGNEVMRVSATYSKDSNVGECSIDATFNITDTYALNECGLFNASTGGTMYCRDTFSTKNVVNGDTVKVYYTGIFTAA